MSVTDDSSSEGDVSDFEARMAAWEADQDEDDATVVFDPGPSAGPSTNPSAEATKLRQQRVWALLEERWAAPSEVEQLKRMKSIIDSSGSGCPDLDDYGELSRCPSQVRPKLWIGSESDAANEQWLLEHRIRAVLNCTESPVSPERQEIYSRLGIEFLHVAMYDDFTEDLGAAVAKARPWLRLQDEAVLVHCFVGGNRSVAVVLSYLVLDEAIDFWDSLGLVAAARGLVLGSGSFPLQLLRLLTPAEASRAESNSRDSPNADPMAGHENL